jgi:CheY-like chemotaxis protein
LVRFRETSLDLLKTAFFHANQKHSPNGDLFKIVLKSTTGGSVSETSAPKPIEILLVEDAPGDVRLTFEAFKKTTIDSVLNVVKDGASALDYLYQKGSFPEAKRPDLIVLDLNVPKINGHEVLAQIKGDPNLKRIPVVILTSSHNPEDIQRAYNNHANCYLIKPNELKDFFEVIRALEDFWLSLVKLPHA